MVWGLQYSKFWEGALTNHSAHIKQQWDLCSIYTFIACMYVYISGIGAVTALNFSIVEYLSCIRWEEPFASPDAIGSILYNITVTGPDASIFESTNHTHYCLKLTPCFLYTATVTPFSLMPPYSTAASSQANSTVTKGQEYVFTEGKVVIQSSICFIDTRKM